MFALDPEWLSRGVFAAFAGGLPAQSNRWNSLFLLRLAEKIQELWRWSRWRYDKALAQDSATRVQFSGTNMSTRRKVDASEVCNCCMDMLVVSSVKDGGDSSPRHLHESR